MPFIPQANPDSGWVVIAPLIIITDSTGQPRYLFTGAPVPLSVGATTLNRLAAGGLITRG